MGTLAAFMMPASARQMPTYTKGHASDSPWRTMAVIAAVTGTRVRSL
ncbi:MAG: hypothetical protein P8170_19865 [Gemmatimonadota bacterium]